MMSKKDAPSSSLDDMLATAQTADRAPLVNVTDRPIIPSDVLHTNREAAQMLAALENPQVDAASKNMLSGLAGDLEGRVRAPASRLYMDGIEVTVPGDAIAIPAALDKNLAAKLLIHIIGKPLAKRVYDDFGTKAPGNPPLVGLSQSLHIELRRTGKLDLSEEVQKYHPDVDDDDENALARALARMFAAETNSLLKQTALLNKLSISATLTILTERILEQRAEAFAGDRNDPEGIWS